MAFKMNGFSGFKQAEPKGKLSKSKTTIAEKAAITAASGLGAAGAAGVTGVVVAKGLTSLSTKKLQELLKTAGDKKRAELLEELESRDE